MYLHLHSQGNFSLIHTCTHTGAHMYIRQHTHTHRHTHTEANSHTHAHMQTPLHTSSVYTHRKTLSHTCTHRGGRTGKLSHSHIHLCQHKHRQTGGNTPTPIRMRGGICNSTNRNHRLHLKLFSTHFSTMSPRSVCMHAVCTHACALLRAWLQDTDLEKLEP